MSFAYFTYIFFYFSTRVIKPNQNDIGRRVKVRSSHPLPYSSSSSHSSPHPVVPPPTSRPPVTQPVPQHVTPHVPQHVPQHVTQHVTQNATQHAQRAPANPDLARRSIKLVYIYFYIIFNTIQFITSISQNSNILWYYLIRRCYSISILPDGK